MRAIGGKLNALVRLARRTDLTSVAKQAPLVDKREQSRQNSRAHQKRAPLCGETKMPIKLDDYRLLGRSGHALLPLDGEGLSLVRGQGLGFSGATVVIRVPVLRFAFSAPRLVLALALAIAAGWRGAFAGTLHAPFAHPLVGSLCLVFSLPIAVVCVPVQGLGLVVVDYLQLIETEARGKNRQGQVAATSRR